MLFDKTYQNFYFSEPTDSAGAIAAGEVTDEEQNSDVVFEEQQVTTTKGSEDLSGYGTINFDGEVAPAKLTFTFEGQEYTISKTQEDSSNAYYGEKGDSLFVFDKYPFAVTWYERFNENQDGITFPTYKWTLYTPDAGTYTIGARLPDPEPEPTSEPKVKAPRTIVSELSRLNKAFGNISKKQTIIGQLSDIANAAEAGKIGVALIVHESKDGKNSVLDKTWKEMKDAAIVFIVSEIENEKEPGVMTWSINNATNFYYIPSDGTHPAQYAVEFRDVGIYETDNENGYPVSA